MRIESAADASSSAPGVPSGFHWEASWVALLAPMRGEGRPPIALDAASLVANIPLDRAKQSYWADADAPARPLTLPDGVVVDGVSGEFAAWTWDERKAALNADALRTRDTLFWLRTFVACAEDARYEEPWKDVSVDWAIDTAVAQFGLAFAVPRCLAALVAHAADSAEMAVLLDNRQAGHRRLRELLAVASDADYAAALAAAQPLRAGGRWALTLLAYIFPGERDILEAAIASLPTVGRAADRHVRWLLNCALTPDEADFLIRERFVGGYGEAGLGFMLNYVRLHRDAALPLVGKNLAAMAGPEAAARRVQLIAMFGNEAALATLIAHADVVAAQTTLGAMLDAMPEAGLRLFAERVLAQRSAAIDTWFARHAGAHRDALAAFLAGIADSDRTRLEAVLAPTGVLMPEADVESLPEVLRDPPWLRAKPKKAKAAPVEPVVASTESAMAWDDGQREQWRAPYHWSDWDDEDSDDDNRLALFDDKRLKRALHRFGFDNAGIERLTRGETAVSSDAKSESRDSQALARMPATIAGAVWRSMPASNWSDYFFCGFRNLLARDELVQLPALLKFAADRPAIGLALCMPFACSEIAPIAAAILRGGSGANRRLAQRWLRKHAALAARTLVAQSQSSEAKARSDAEFALRMLAAQPDGTARLDAAIASLGDAGSAQLARVLTFDPLSLFPTRLPTLPEFWRPSMFSRLRLADGRLVPLPALAALGTMLAFDKPDRPYAGLDQVRAAFDPASLGAFAWDLFDAWQRAGCPSKEQWAFFALATLGDEATARRLAVRIREWPAEGAFSRSVVGLDVLLRMGNDMALALLHGMAQKMKSRSLQQRAQAKLDALAEQRGLSAAELEDRVVPTFGLDDAGGLDLDYGARRFRVVFDEELKPLVLDENGKRIKDLPKPGAKDDAALATPANERYKQLKKDVRTVAAIQIKRLEAAMCGERRWNAADFRTFVAGHPLIGHLARRLLWAAVDENGARQAFRIAEDRSFADADDQTFVLPDDAEVVLPHPLALDAAVLAAFGQVFADYEILQPFAQLGRETFVLTDAEGAQQPLERWNGRTLEAVRLLGLESRGWRRGPVEDGPRINGFERDLPNGSLHLAIEPGIEPYDVRGSEPQTLAGVYITHNRQSVGAAELGSLWASEIVRDIESLLV
jgi:hypothetical protein